MITVQEEKFFDWYQEGMPIFQRHWQDLGLDKEHVTISMDYDRYKKMEELNLIFCVTARADGKLVGYIITFLISHMHYSTSGLMALTDMYYILPEFRKGGLGVRLFKRMEQGLRDRKVVRAHSSCKVHEDHSKFLQAMGWKLTDYTFSKLLKE